MRRNTISVEENVEQAEPGVKVCKMTKIKLIKELNHKNNSIFQDGKINSNKFSSSKNVDLLVRRQRPRNLKSGSICISNESNLRSANSQNLYTKNMRMDGEVDYTDANGNKFQGIYLKGIRVSGKMIYSDASCEYEGSFLGQKFNGHGIITFYDGRSIQGEWQEQVLVGSAIINYPNGDVYYGDVNQKLYKHGKGHLFLKNGDKYIGGFFNGSITGFGAFYHEQKMTVKGHWARGRLVKQIKTGQQHEMDSYSSHHHQEWTLESKQKAKTSGRENSSANHQEQSICSPMDSNLRLNIRHSEKNETFNQNDTSKSQLFILAGVRKHWQSGKG